MFQQEVVHALLETSTRLAAKCAQRNSCPSPDSSCPDSDPSQSIHNSYMRYRRALHDYLLLSFDDVMFLEGRMTRYNDLPDDQKLLVDHIVNERRQQANVLLSDPQA